MVRYNYKSDFAFRLGIVSGEVEAVEGQPSKNYVWPTCDFAGKLTTYGYSVPYKFGVRDGVPYNCERDGDLILVVVDGHELGTGALRCELTLWLPNAMYPDQTETVTLRCDTGVVLDTRSDMPVQGLCTVDVMMPFMLQTAYDLAVRNGYQGTREQYEQATLGLVETVDEATRTLEQSQQAASDAAEASRQALDVVGSAGEVLADCRTATAEANRQALEARLEAEIAHNAAASAELNARRAQLVADSADDWAKKSEGNIWETGQTINGILTVNGDIVQNGQYYETAVEHIISESAHITLRNGAVGAMGADERAGLKINRYDGSHDGAVELSGDGTLRIGDSGDAQPVLTRLEAFQLPDGALLRWDAQRMCAVPMRVDIIEAEVTYEDDSVVTFKLLCDASE